MKILFLSITLSLSSTVFAKRLAPPEVKPLTHAGLRYEIPHWVSDIPKATHNGGYIRVVNTRNNVVICTKEVYVVKIDPQLESDVQDNFIRRIRIEKNEMIIESEKLPPIKKSLEGFCD